ncbi:MAG: MmgE/PrpD family protein, partial [Pseudomonadota bacterium]
SGQSLEQTLIEELTAVTMRDVDSRDLTRARFHLLDWTGCAVAGSASESGKSFRSVITGGTTDMSFYLGALGNILEMDDVDKRAILHPGPSIVPVAVALGSSLDVDMVEVLSAIVRGYEATIRLGRAAGPGHYAVWHSTGTCGAVGAAAAASSLMQLDANKAAHALALGVSQSAGFWQTRHDPQSMGKQLHTAHASRAGHTAAALANAGGRGPLEVLEGPQGFFAAMCPDGNPSQLLQDYEELWLIHQVSFKPWPACRHAHAAIDAALAVAEELADTDEIESVSIETYDDALKFCDKPKPQSVIEAKFSLQHSAAVAISRGKPELADFELDAIRSSDLAVLRNKIKVAISPTYDDAYPQRYGAGVVVTRRSGSVLSASAPDALGDPENPVSDELIVEKAKSLMLYGGASEADAQSLCDLALDETSSATALMSKLEEVIS